MEQRRPFSAVAAAQCAYDAILDRQSLIVQFVSTDVAGSMFVDEQDKQAILNIIRARAKDKADTQSEPVDASDPQKQRRKWQGKQDSNTAWENEAATKAFVQYITNVKLVGPIDKRNRRIVELAEIEQKLREGKHVQNRTLETWLTADEFAEIDKRWQRQQLIRSGSKLKLDSVKAYEAMLKKAQFYDAKARGEEERGNTVAAKASRDLCQNKLSELLIYLQNNSANDLVFLTWLDRDIPTSTDNLTLQDMPRSITSTGKDVRVQRQSISEIKIAVVQGALRTSFERTD
jgi:hypothetical protein